MFSKSIKNSPNWYGWIRDPEPQEIVADEINSESRHLFQGEVIEVKGRDRLDIVVELGVQFLRDIIQD